MKIFFVATAVACAWAPLLAQEAGQKQESKTPLMVSFTDLKWVELPQRKGLSGDPKRGEYTQIRRVPARMTNNRRALP